jgi:hypothetical protein
MEAPTIIVTTPISGLKVYVYQWITGRKAEYIQEPILAATKMGSPTAGGAFSVSSFDAKVAIHESNHREIESYIAKVEEETDPKKCIELILDLPEKDYEFIQTHIATMKEQDKKKS